MAHGNGLSVILFVSVSAFANGYSQPSLPGKQETKGRNESQYSAAKIYDSSSKASSIVEQMPATQHQEVRTRNAESRDQETEKPFWEKARDDPIAAATIAVAFFTFCLIVVGYWQSRQLSKTVDAMRDNFLSTHRPKIRVKHLVPNPEIESGKPINVKLVIVNVGVTEAFVKELAIKSLILPSSKKLPPRPQYSGGIARLDPGRLESGVTIPLKEVTIHDPLTDAEHAAIRGGSQKLYCYGYIRYEDARKRIRDTAFCRAWEPSVGVGALSEPGRFVNVDDPDYEYQD